MTVAAMIAARAATEREHKRARRRRQSRWRHVRRRWARQLRREMALAHGSPTRVRATTHQVVAASGREGATCRGIDATVAATLSRRRWAG